jgi:hypothetical protein
MTKGGANNHLTVRRLRADREVERSIETMNIQMTFILIGLAFTALGFGIVCKCRGMMIVAGVVSIIFGVACIMMVSP